MCENMTTGHDFGLAEWINNKFNVHFKFLPYLNIFQYNTILELSI